MTSTPIKPKPPSKQRKFSTDAEVVVERGTNRQSLIPTPKSSKLGAEKLTPEEQSRRFEELAREAGCDEGSDARFEAAVGAIGKLRPKDEEKT